MAKTPGSCLQALVFDGACDFLGRKVIRHQTIRFQPDTHGIIPGTKGLGIPDAGDTLQFGDQVDLDIVLQKSFIIRAVLGRQADKHDDTVLLFLGGNPRLYYFLRNLAGGLGYPVLHVYRSNIRIGPLLEINSQGHASVIAGIRSHIGHVLHAVNGFLQRSSHRTRHDFGIGSRVVSRHHYTGWGDIREQGDGQGKYGKPAQ